MLKTGGAVMVVTKLIILAGSIAAVIIGIERALFLRGFSAKARELHEQIVRAAKAQRADLVVIGTHGRSGLAKFFVGSVAGRVVSAARCPVLTVRGK